MNKNLPNRQQLGTFLKKNRELKHVKQWWIAEQLEVSESYISKVESGRITIRVVIFSGYCSLLKLSDEKVMEGLFGKYN